MPTPPKTKSLLHIEERMSELDPQGMRYKVLEAAKDFKGSWFHLGQCLYTVNKDKLYRQWGFLTFDNYCLKEIGIRKQTAVKLLRSYFFIEKDEPDLVNSIPNYEAVNLLRLAKKNTNIDEDAYKELREDIFTGQKDFSDVKKQFRSLVMASREQGDPEQEHRKAFQGKIRRIISSLKSIKLEVEIKNILPAKILKQVDELIAALEEKLEGVEGRE